MLKVKGISEIEKKLMIHEGRINEKGQYTVYSTKGYEEITTYHKNVLQKKPKDYQLKHLLVQIEDKFKGTLEDYYKKLVKDADDFKRLTKGKINMYKTGSYSKTALKYLYDILNEKKIEPEPLQDYECRFLMNCGGAFRHAKPYQGPLYKYDARSYHASIYSSVNLLIPIKAGILKTLTKEEFNNMDRYPIGVYRCEVKRPTDDNKYLVWINKEKYYTHYELTYFKELGLDYQIIEEKDNFLNYPRDYCLTGSQIFGEYAKTIYNLKTKHKVEGGRELLNYIVGMLTKKNKDVKIVGIDDIDITEKEKYIYIGDGKYEYVKLRQKPFEYDLGARLKPFFYARCRLTMSKLVKPIFGDVYYSHTDSIISSKELNFNDKGNIGNLKYYGKCENGFIKDHNVRSKDNDFIKSKSK